MSCQMQIVKTIVENCQKQSNKVLANEHQEVKRYTNDWNKLKVMTLFDYLFAHYR